jgi:hypothetical protein
MDFYDKRGGGYMDHIFLSNLGRLYRNHIGALVEKRKGLKSITSRQKELLEQFLEDRERIPAKQLRNIKTREKLYLHEKIKAVVEKLLELPVTNE